MGLEQYVIALVTFVNNIFIPFLMGLAFLFFVVNAVRFFVVGGANADSKEKARSLAVYGMLAFVLIIVFWGIVGLLSSSLGLQALGERTARCSDYDPNCDIAPADQTSGGANLAGNFGTTGIGDPRGADLGSPNSGFGSSANVALPDISTDVSPNTSNPGTRPTQPNQPAGLPEYTAYVATEDAIKPAANEFIRAEAPDLFGRHTSLIADDLFADLPQVDRDMQNFSDVDRVQASMRLAITGAISNETSLQYQTQLVDYYDIVSPGYYETNIAPNIMSTSKSIPTNVQANFNQTLSLIEDELTTYYTSVGMSMTSAEASQAVANNIATLETGSVDDRFEALETLYDQNILRDPNNVIYDQFSEDMNVINIYAGERPGF